MPVILSLETSTDVCSVALHAGEKLIAEAVLQEPQSHASRLAPLIQEIITRSGKDLKDLRAIAISSGPGSYTGLRIGTSTAKGMCYALEIPLIAIGTLELLAFQGKALNPSGALLCPMIDARRMEVYSLLAGPDLEIIEPVAARVIDHESFAETLKDNRVLFFGNGAKKCEGIIEHPNALFVDDVFPRASALGVLAMKKFSSRDFEDLVHFKPFYLKEFEVKKPRAGA